MGRRALIGLAVGLGLPRARARASSPAAWGLPIARGGATPGDGFFIKHGFGCQNPTYYPGLTHTGENWYGLGANAAGADVLAVAAGEVVYADFDYPGRVVIVRHSPELFSVYGHLDPALAVRTGVRVERGDRIGAVLARADDYERSHLHVELRTFLMSDRINGASPEHGFTCGPQCPPGPGYWPADAEHPAALGWRNPTHVIARRAFPDGLTGADAVAVVPASPSADSTPLWNRPSWRAGAEQVGVLELKPGDRIPLRQIATGADDSTGRDAAAYRLWFRVEPASGTPAWAQAALPSTLDRNADGAPAAITFDLLIEG